MIKRFLALILSIIVFLLGVTGCSEDKKKDNSKKSSNKTNTSAKEEPKEEQTVFYHNVDKSIPEDYLDDYVKRHTADKIVTYKELNGENLELCYYFPRNYDKNSKYPVFMVIHGGGWASRNVMKDQEKWSGDYLGFLARYYADKGFISVVTTYGLLKREGQDEEKQLFDLYADCQDAMNYVADHADEYGADLTNVTLLGESAGGHLAAAMATNSFYENRLPLRTAILVNPITNLYYDKWGNNTPNSSTRPLLQGKDKNEINKMLSPLQNITENTPNVLLIHGSVDSVVDLSHSTMFNDKMAQMGSKSELHVINGANHAFLLREYYKNVDHTNVGVKIIDDYFAKYSIIK